MGVLGLRAPTDTPRQYSLALSDWSVINADGTDAPVWEVRPEPDGLYYAIMLYHQKLPTLPFYVVENGFPTDNGTVACSGCAALNYTRSDHLMDHIYWLQRVMAQNVSVIGYNYWSIADNYEWGSFSPRFGLYTVDVLTDPTLTRVATDAVCTYKRVINNWGVPADYTPVMPPVLCNAANTISACVGQIVALGEALLSFTSSPTATPSPTGGPGCALWPASERASVLGPQTGSSTTAPTPGPDPVAGLSTGAAVGVGVGVAGALVGLAAAGYVARRAARARSQDAAGVVNVENQQVRVPRHVSRHGNLAVGVPVQGFSASTGA